MSKKMEVMAKRIFKNADTKKLSAVPSDKYGDRFIKFMKGSVFDKPIGEEKDNMIRRMIS